MPYIIYVNIESESLIKEIVGCQMIQKIIQQQKLESTFLVDIQYKLYGLLII